MEGEAQGKFGEMVLKRVPSSFALRTRLEKVAEGSAVDPLHAMTHDTKEVVSTDS